MVEFNKNIISEENLELIKDVIIKEIREVFVQICTNKVPGADGFELFFFNEYWDIIGKDVLKVI